MTGPQIFADRRQAGRLLGQAVARLALHDPVVLALPRGGVPVGFEVARAIDAPLDILLVRKIGAPGHEEYGIGALVDGAQPQVEIDQAMARMVGADQAYIDRTVARERAELERRRAAYRTGPAEPLAGRTVILVDDGIATGGTARAALRALAKVGAKQIVLAVPVGPAETLDDLAKHCDRVVCLSMPQPFYAVGAHFEDFSQTGDAEVIELLQTARWTSPGTGA
jgi:putative phosphoribosyl transferase